MVREWRPRSGGVSQSKTGRSRGIRFGLVFFQAEDGIRVIGVTGVQTCALPIYVQNYDEVSPVYVRTSGSLNLFLMKLIF